MILNTQYKMMFYVLVETYTKMLKELEANRDEMQKLLKDFTIKIATLNFEISPADSRYKDINSLFKILKGVIETGTEVVDAHDVLFIKSESTDKRLLKILFDFTRLTRRLDPIA